MKKIIALVFVVIFIVLITTYTLYNSHQQGSYLDDVDVGDDYYEEEELTNTNVEDDIVPSTNNENNASNVSNNLENNLSEFDLSFLKMEQDNKNLIYSPLSIKYALRMLEEATVGESKEQISKLLGDKLPTKYTSNENMSLANAMFIRDSFQNQVKESYIDLLKSKYNAEIMFDGFENASKINDWIKTKTFKIIPQMLTDDEAKSLQFALVNAIAIDMEWEQKFLEYYNDDEHMNWEVNYDHEKMKSDNDDEYGWYLRIHVYASVREYQFC